MTPKIGDFGLTRIPGYVGSLITLGEWANGDGFGDYDHAFVLVDDAGTIVEAEPGGARLSNCSEYKDITWSSWDLTDKQRNDIAHAALELLGTKYSVADYFSLAAHRLHIPAPFLKTRVETSRYLICSQLADRAYHNAGLEMFQDGRWDGYVTPASLRKALKGPVIA